MNRYYTTLFNIIAILLWQMICISITVFAQQIVDKSGNQAGGKTDDADSQIIGFSPGILKFFKQTAADINITPQMLKFGGIDTSKSDTLSFVIKNSGDDTLFVDSIYVRSAHATTGNIFAVIDSIDTVTASPLDSMVVRTIFSPDSQKIYSDSLIIYHRKKPALQKNSLGFFVKGKGFKYGDITGNFAVTAIDASLVLQYTAGTYSISGNAVVRADVTVNGAITAYDAALILQYAVGKITSFPADLLKPVKGRFGDGSIQYVLNYDKATKTLSMPVSIEDPANIYSMEIELEHKGIVYTECTQGDIIKDCISKVSDRDGVLKLAFAGTSPVTDKGTIVTFYFAVSDEKAIQSIAFKRIMINESEYDVSGLHTNNAIPNEFNLSQNYPNPFNPITKIQYQLPRESKVSLIIYNVLGQHIKTLVNESFPAGYYAVQWDGRDASGTPVASGVYFYRLKASGYVKTRKMLFLK